MTPGSAGAPPRVIHNIAASQLHTADISAQGDDSNSRGAAMSCLTAGIPQVYTCGRFFQRYFNAVVLVYNSVINRFLIIFANFAFGEIPISPYMLEN